MVHRSQSPTYPIDRISRRRVLAGCLAAASTLLSRQVSAQTPSRTMQQPIGLELLQTRLKMELEVDGEVRLAESKNSKDNTAPLKSKATHDYLESIAYRDNQPVAAGRRYITAQGENWVAGKSVTHKLREELADTRVVREGGTWEQYSPAQPMERREVDLLRSPVNSLALEKILPLEPARADSKWTISAEDARDIFNLDDVQRSTLVAKIASVEKGTAKIELQGSLQASANSVPTELQIRGTAHVTLCSQCAIVSWLGISIKETREISESQPGFSVTARLQLVRQELKDKLAVTRDELLVVADQKDPGNWLVHLDSRCHFTMLTNRKWVTYLDSGEDAILRYVDNNKVIAQCNVARLPKLDAGNQLTLAGLQSDIQQTLGKSFTEFLESSERVSGTKLRLLRAEAAGKQEEVSIHWIYAHLSDDSGRRMAMVFTLAAEYAEAFSGQDLQMLDSFEFKESFTPSVETPKAPTSETAKKPTKAVVK